jgi:WD40 repeat protein
VACLSSDNTLQVWDVATAQLLGPPIKLYETIRQVAFSGDTDQIVVISTEGVARVWQIQSAELLATSPQGGLVTQARVSPDGRRIVTTAGASGARVWDATMRRAVTPSLRHGGSSLAVAFSPDGKYLVTVGKGGAVCVWELSPEPEMGPAAPGEEGPLAEDLLVPTAPRQIKLGDGTIVQVRRAAAGGALRRPQEADGVVAKAVFSPNGRRVVVLGKDDWARLWETATGELAATPWQAAGVVYTAFSPDGSRLLTVGEDRMVRLWDAVSGEVLAPPRRQTQAIRHAFFRSDGNTAIVVGEGGRVDVWNLTPDPRPTATLQALAQVLSGSRIEKQQRQALDGKMLQINWKLIHSEE